MVSEPVQLHGRHRRDLGGGGRLGGAGPCPGQRHHRARRDGSDAGAGRCAAAAGFAVWNWQPAKVFLGDVGSVPLGFPDRRPAVEAGGRRLLGPCPDPAALLSGRRVDHPGAPPAPRRERVWQAHRQHFYQQAVGGRPQPCPGQPRGPGRQSGAGRAQPGGALPSPGRRWPAPALVVAALLAWLARRERTGPGHRRRRLRRPRRWCRRWPRPAGRRFPRAGPRSARSGATPTGGRIWTDIDAVIHLAAAGVHGRVAWTAAEIAALREVNVYGTERLAAAAREAGVKRFVLVSSARAMAETSTRRSPPTRPRADRPLRPVQARRRSGGPGRGGRAMEVVILRPPLVYGPGAGGSFGRLAAAVRRGLPLPLGRSTAAAQPDLRGEHGRCAGPCADAARRASTFPATGTTSALPTWRARWAAALGRRPRLLPCPPWLLRLAGAATGRRAPSSGCWRRSRWTARCPAGPRRFPFETAIARSLAGRRPAERRPGACLRGPHDFMTSAMALQLAMEPAPGRLRP